MSGIFVDLEKAWRMERKTICCCCKTKISNQNISRDSKLWSYMTVYDDHRTNKPKFKSQAKYNNKLNNKLNIGYHIFLISTHTYYLKTGNWQPDIRAKSTGGHMVKKSREKTLPAWLKGYPKKTSFLKNCDGSGGRTVWPRRLSFSQFIILMSTTNCEKDSLLGQTVLPPEPSQFFKKEGFLDNPLAIWLKNQQMFNEAILT